jgi:hypothetical protein
MPLTGFCDRALVTQALLILAIVGPAQGIINKGGSIVVSGNASLVLVDGGIVNNRSFSAGHGTVVFRGTATGVSIGGSSHILLNNLSLEKTSGDVLLGADIAVDSILSMSGGNLQLNGFTLDLGSGAGAIMGENNDSRITGPNGGLIRKKALLNNPSGVNPGNIGLSITSTADWGMTIIERGHMPQTCAAGGASVNRYFDIRPGEGAGLNAALKFYCLDAELAGRRRSELSLWASSDNGSVWKPVGDNIANGVMLAIRQKSRITLAGVVDRPPAFSVFPNPVSDKINLVIHSDRSQQLRIALYDAIGRLVSFKDLTIEPGDELYEWDISLVATGTYFLRSSDARLPVIKIIKKPE